MQASTSQEPASSSGEPHSDSSKGKERRVEWSDLDDVKDVPSETEASGGEDAEDKTKILDKLLDVEEEARKQYEEGLRTADPAEAIRRLNEALTVAPTPGPVPAPVPMFAPSAESTTMLDLSRRLSSLEKKMTAAASSTVEQKASHDLKIADLTAQVAALTSENERLRHLVSKFENEALKRLRSLDDEFVTVVNAAAKHVATLAAPPEGLEPERLQAVSSAVEVASAATVVRPAGVSSTTGIYKKKKFVGQRQ